jgi:hypothetical protein
MRTGLQRVKEIMNVEPYRIWQNAYAWLVNRYVDLEDYVSACKTLETAYVFKPASESAKNWEKLAGRINRAANRSGLALDCRIKLHVNGSR